MGDLNAVKMSQLVHVGLLAACGAGDLVESKLSPYGGVFSIGVVLMGWRRKHSLGFILMTFALFH